MRSREPGVGRRETGDGEAKVHLCDRLQTLVPWLLAPDSYSGMVAD